MTVFVSVGIYIQGERFAKNIGSLYYDVDKRSPNTAHEVI